MGCRKLSYYYVPELPVLKVVSPNNELTLEKTNKKARREHLDEVCGEGNTYTAEFWMYEARLGRRWNVDPVDKPWMSSYHAFSNKPITNIDPNGDSDGDYYTKDKQYLGNDGIDDNKVYTVEGTSRFNIKDFEQGGKYQGKESDFNKNNGDGYSVNYVGDVAQTRMTFTGTANAQNANQSDGQVKVLQVLGNGEEFTRLSIGAIGGPFGNGSPENGRYTVDNARRRTDNNGMIRDGVGFSLDLNPTFTTCRTLLRVHPDGNNAGTLGCIGLQGNATQLNGFYNYMSSYLNANGNIRMDINITNNPNNNGCNPTAPIPNIRE